MEKEEYIDAEGEKKMEEKLGRILYLGGEKKNGGEGRIYSWEGRRRMENKEEYIVGRGEEEWRRRQNI